MTSEQQILCALLVFLMLMLVWGRWRYDLIAFFTLFLAVIIGVVPLENAFSGFGHSAVIIVALVLIVSRGSMNAGVVDLLARPLLAYGKSLFRHIFVLSGIAAAMSAVLNNVGALALLMPVDIRAANKAKRSPALSLMPLSFASILGGLVTLIGTPPNIIIASYRAETLGAPFSMFDFTPVGLICAVVGVLFVSLVGWRLLPKSLVTKNQPRDLYETDDYTVELKVPENSKVIGQSVSDLKLDSDEAKASLLAVFRRGKKLTGRRRNWILRKNDILVIESNPQKVEEVAGELGLTYVGQEKHQRGWIAADMQLQEAVVPVGARIEGRSSLDLRMLYRHNVTLLGISRRGSRIRERIRESKVQAGDLLLLYGPSARLGSVIDWLGCFSLSAGVTRVIQRDKAWFTIALFTGAILLASFGVLPLVLALAFCCGAMVVTNIIPLSELYDHIEWPVLVLLASLIPIGEAMETSGTTNLLGRELVTLTGGAHPAVMLTLVMILTMTLSDILNNTATALIAAPLAFEVATRLQVNPDTFLMAVAIGASCAFLTPIGHKNNTLIMGPGGYGFGDYWRMGLPLEILIIGVSIPALLFFWPL